ncbi:MAG TPA: glycoside hydrolase family 2 TIM barrel-domain containing protein [Victivallales bacterium]|nr:glycoside hydrolase family 2 TIM barrel-domain containing protein [Victivallales bacterium]HRR29508.1 glycoside hydrolase family 2 TIM barrel-domain containing protein [Victivallales bacterium]
MELKEDWLFKWDKNDEGLNSEWWKDNYPRNGWEKVTLPRVWNMDSINFSPKTPIGVGWFYKKVQIPDKWSGEISLLFLSVMYSTDIWINGKFMLSHNGGFTPFFVKIPSDITDTSKTFEIVLRVDNRLSNQTIPSLKHGWNTYGGICREVFLISQPESRIEDLKVQTFLEDKNRAILKIKGKLKKFEQKNKNAIFASISLEEKVIVSKELTLVSINDEDAEFNEELSVDSPHLWSPEDPFMYKLNFHSKEKILISMPLGIREIRINGEKFFLNGKEYWLQGFGLHEDIKSSGPIIPPDFLENEIRKIKEFGANHIRTGHYPHHPRTYLLCDKIGLLAFVELPAWQLDRTWAGSQTCWEEWGRPQLVEMLKFYGNFTSIISWSASNEMGGAHEFNKRAIAFLVETDSSRIATAVVDSNYHPEIYAYLPFAGRNLHYGLYHSKRIYDGLRRGLTENLKYSEKANIPLWISELGGKAWRGRFNSNYKTDQRDNEFYADKNLRFGFQYCAVSSEVVCGISIWTWTDFYQSGGSICNHGIFDIERRPKLVAYTTKNLMTGNIRLFICEDDSSCESGGTFSAKLYIFNPNKVQIPSGLKVRWIILKNQQILSEGAIPVNSFLSRSEEVGKVNWDIPEDARGFFSLWAELIDQNNNQIYCNSVHFGTTEDESPGVLFLNPNTSEKNDICAYAVFDWMKIPIYNNPGLIIPLSEGNYKFKILSKGKETMLSANIQSANITTINF